MPEQRSSNTEEENRKCESAYLVTLKTSTCSHRDAENHLDELRSLVRTMGLETVGGEVYSLKQLHPGYLVGKGMAEKIINAAEDVGADLIIFDDDLSPSQQRNLEKLGGITVIDRQEVILDIFASRASTREATLQVALARMEYSLPRLTRAWTHLSRQRGGGARSTRGEGEAQLEVDRRLLLRKITHLKSELVKVQRQRAGRRRRRLSRPVPTAAIVGYTNAGKSTLLNALTNAAVPIEDKLFATLDPTTRRVKISSSQEILLTDTVGFIRKLPHSLVDSFKSTLEETVLADFLIHVVDISDLESEEHSKTTLKVLEEIGAADKPVLTVYNKIDLLKNRDDYRLKQPGSIGVSILRKEGIDRLLERIAEEAARDMMESVFLIPMEEISLVAMARETGLILREEYSDRGVDLHARVPGRIHARLKPYTV